LVPDIFSFPTVLASGCLGGYVRVWDIVSGGSEIWRTDGVIASLTFHPFDRLGSILQNSVSAENFSYKFSCWKNTGRMLDNTQNNLHIFT
jgi:hypothetical protein